MNDRFITGISGLNGIAVDGNYIYWANGSGAIGRANLDGTGVNESFISGIIAEALAVDGMHIYFANGFGGSPAVGPSTETVARAKLDGTGVNTNFISPTAGDIVYGVAVDGTYIYWTNVGSETIGRANLDGTGVNQNFISLGVGVDVGYLAISPVSIVPIVMEIEPNPIALNLPISVTVLGSTTVDVTKIDVTTLRFGPKGATPVSTQIVSADGQVDLVASFDVQDTGLTTFDTQACLQGTIGGQPFGGCDAVVVINYACGLGIELAPILPVLLWLRGRRRRKLA